MFFPLWSPFPQSVCLRKVAIINPLFPPRRLSQRPSSHPFDMQSSKKIALPLPSLPGKAAVGLPQSSKHRWPTHADRYPTPPMSFSMLSAKLPQHLQSLLPFISKDLGSLFLSPVAIIFSPFCHCYNYVATNIANNISSVFNPVSKIFLGHIRKRIVCMQVIKKEKKQIFLTFS